MQTSSYRVPIMRRDRESISEQKCCVCSCLTREFHFGAVCCVACGAFFRRAVSEGRIFVCRKNGCCPIDANGRAACRSCRFQKCISMGMDPAAVQPSRGSIGKRKDSGDTSTSNTPPHIELNALQNIGDVISLFETKEDICNTEHQPNSVENFLLAYDSLKNQRRHIYSNGSLAELIRGDDPHPHKVNIFSRIRRSALRTECALVLNLLRHCKLFGLFDLHDKEELFKNFMMMMTIMEKYYLSMQNGGIELMRIYHVDGSYSDLDDEETVFPPEAVDAQMDRDTMVKLFVKPCIDHLTTVATPMRDMGMNDTDFVGFLTFNLFDPDIPTLRPARRFLVDQARSRIHTDWLEAYRKKGIPNGQLRIARCMGLLPLLQEILEAQKEKFHLLRVFKLFDYDQILGDLFSFKNPSDTFNGKETQVESPSTFAQL